LLRVFTQGDDIVRAEPEGPGDEEIAKQITGYLNYIFYRDNPGFSILNIWFKDALLQKNGMSLRFTGTMRSRLTRKSTKT
jgi:hypothetical protein